MRALMGIRTTPQITLFANSVTVELRILGRDMLCNFAIVQNQLNDFEFNLLKLFFSLSGIII